MKQCPYCGKEYPDDAMVCAIDGEVLKSDTPEPEPLPAVEATAVAEKAADLRTYPDYQWTAKDAWKCVGMIVVLGLIYECILVWFKHHSAILRWSSANGVGYSVEAALYCSLSLFAAAYFARTETFKTFLTGFGLDKRPTEYVWWGIVGAIVLRIFGLFAFSWGWTHGIRSYDLDRFWATSTPDRYFYLLPLLIFAPLVEESANRGFLYKAFRGTYQVPVSTLLIIGWAAFRHWHQYSNSWAAAVDISLLTALQCYLREKSPSLWDCILCHFAFNLSSLLV